MFHSCINGTIVPLKLMLICIYAPMESGKGGAYSSEKQMGMSPEKEKTKGGIRTMPFIIASEACDKLAAVGFHANMITYVTQQLNMPLVQASNTITNFSGTASFTPLIGALLADCYAGQFWTIIFGSLFYQVGLISITISALTPSLHPPPCPTQENCTQANQYQLWAFYISLLLTCLGTGGIRPCVVTFSANQFDMGGSGESRGKWNFFNWYYFSMSTATLIALTVIVYIQDNIGWGWGLGIPTVCMALSLIAFIVGAPLYKKPKPAGSPLVRVAQVAVAAMRKRRAIAPADPNQLYENKALDTAIATDGMLLHSDQFKWLDKAAIVTDEEPIIDELKQPNLWRLATVHRVEELKSIIRMLPIWASSILMVLASSHQGSFVIQQARSMNRHLSPSFQIPPASMGVFSILTTLIGLVLYERLLVPMAKRFTKNPAGFTCLQRMGIGFVINIFATLAAALIETRRKSVAAEYHLLDSPTTVIPISVFWLVPQYVVHGLADVFMSVGHMEFLYDQAPESMRSTAAALYWIAIGLASYLGTFFVTMVHKYTDWIPDWNLNRGRLEYYYLLVSGIQVINLLYYVIAAWMYTYKPLERASNDVEIGENEKENQSESSVGGGEDREVELVRN